MRKGISHMAFNETGVRIGAAGHFASRITAALITSGQITVEQAADTFADYTSTCLDVLNALEAVTHTAAPAAPAAPQRSAVEAMEAELGATTVQATPAGGPTVLNSDGTGEPFEPWALAQFKAAGITKVFDNRSTKTGNQPWYKTPKDAEKYGEPSDKAFWPPRK
jgi:hypothetical protein